MTATQFASWAIGHKEELLGDVSAVIGAASVVVASTAKLVDLLVGAFPGLKVTDEKLHWAVAWLKGISKSPLLNSIALNNSHAKAKAPVGEAPINNVTKIALTLLLVSVTLPASAQASGLDWSAGPSLPFLEYDFGNPHPVQVAPGTGIQLSITHDALKRAIFGKSWDILDLQLSAFGSVVSAQSGQQFGAFSGALGLGFFSSLISINVGKHILGADQSFTHGGWFMGLALNLNVALSPTAPPVGLMNGPVGLPRANTLYFY